MGILRPLEIDVGSAACVYRRTRDRDRLINRPSIAAQSTMHSGD